MKISEAIITTILAGAVHGQLGILPLGQTFGRMPCRGQSGIGRADPIMDPGEISSHVHSIFGGNGELLPEFRAQV